MISFIRPGIPRPLGRWAVALLVAANIGALAFALSTPRAHASTARQLTTFWHEDRSDNFLTGTVAEENRAVDAGYWMQRREGWVWTAPETGLVPLHLFWSDARQDYFSTATQIGIDSAFSAGYRWIEVQGYVSANKHYLDPMPLYLFWNSDRQDNFTTATQEGIDAAYSAHYTLVRIEGWVPRP